MTNTHIHGNPVNMKLGLWRVIMAVHTPWSYIQMKGFWSLGCSGIWNNGHTPVFLQENGADMYLHRGGNGDHNVHRTPVLFGNTADDHVFYNDLQGDQVLGKG